MNKKLKWSIISLSILFILYTLLWFAIELTICNKVNKELSGKPNTINLNNNGSYYIITFSKTTPYGFPFKFGIKIHGMSEETGSSLVTHYEPVNIGYDLLKQSLYITYNAKSTARPKPLAGGFGTEIEGEFTHYIRYPLSFKLIEITQNPLRQFELVNFIESVEINARNIKAYDIVDKSLLLDQNYLHSRIDISGKSYYHNSVDLLRNPPSGLRLFSSSKINSAVKGRRIAVGSLVYGILPSAAPTHEIDIGITTDAHDLDLHDLIGTVEIKCDKWHVSNDTEDSDAIFYYKVSRQDENLNIEIRTNSSLDIKPGFFEKVLDTEKEVAQYVINMDAAGAALIRPMLNAFLENPAKYLPPKNDLKKIEASIDMNIHGSNDKFEINLKEFSALFDGAGIKLTNTSELDNVFSWKTSGVLCINDYKNVVDFAIDYKNQILDKEYAVKTSAFYKDVDKSLLRLISNHPESESNDIVLSYEFNANSEANKIGTLSIEDVKKLYQQTLYAKAMEIVKEEPNLVSALKELAPELMEDKNFLQQLQKTTNSPIQP